MNLLSGAQAWHWSIAGAAIGAITLTLLFVANRRLGVSGGFDNACGLVSRAPYFLKATKDPANRWKLIFLVGLIVGGALSALSTGTWGPTWALGKHDAVFAMGPVGKSLWMFGGGLAIGFGTRLAGGCTSGHGIFGVANFEKASWLNMLTFMAVGVVVTNVIYRVLG